MPRVIIALVVLMMIWIVNLNTKLLLFYLWELTDGAGGKSHHHAVVVYITRRLSCQMGVCTGARYPIHSWLW